MQISTDSKIQNISQAQKVENQTKSPEQNLNQNLYQAAASKDNLNTNLETQLKQTLVNFLQNLSSNTQSKDSILEMLKSTNLFKNFSNASTLLKSILNGLESNPSLKSFASQIQNFILNIENLDGANLKQNITNSGIFLESKLLQNQKQDIATDMKGLLLNLKQQLDTNLESNKELLKQVDRMLIQIDYYQLLSLTSNSPFIYLSFDWDSLEDGDLSFYKDDDEFVCNINLQLKEFGEVKVSLRLVDEKNLSINFFIEDEEFKELIRDNFSKLKQNLQKQGLSISNLSIKDISKELTKNNPYNTNNNLSINLDIRV